MKGLILSLAIFAVYVITAIALMHWRKPERHAKWFVGVGMAWIPVLVMVFLATPPNLGFIPATWLADPVWLDLALAVVFFLLNVHNFMDFFYGFNGGFSTSILLNVYRSRPHGLTTAEMILKYRAADGTDKIMGWRLPGLERSGYIAIDKPTNRCTLKPKGRRIALLTRALKRLLNLGKGG